MSPEEKLEMGRKLIAEAEAEIAAKKRNWPEKIEPGMVFRHIRSEREHAIIYVVANHEGVFPELLGIIGTGGIRTTGSHDWLQRAANEFEYLGMDRDVLTIKIADDAHEPTGAELVGKVCMFRGFNLGQDNPEEWFGPWMCQTFDPDDATSAYRTGEVGELTGWYKEARLAKDAR